MVYVCKVYVNKFYMCIVCYICIICNYWIKYLNKYFIFFVFNCYYNIKVIIKMFYLSYVCYVFFYINVI